MYFMVSSGISWSREPMAPMTPKPFWLPSTCSPTCRRSLPSVSTMILGARSRKAGSMYLSHMSSGSSTCPSASITLYTRAMAVVPPLFGEPDGIELLVEEVARRDRPATHLRQMRHDPMPLESHHEVHFVVVEPLLVRAQVLL